MGPCFKMAWRAYSLQVGVKRQEGPRRGDKNVWYARMGSTRSQERKRETGFMA